MVWGEIFGWVRSPVNKTFFLQFYQKLWHLNILGGGGSLVALAVAEDEKPPASIALDDKTFKEKVLAFQI